MRVYDGGWADLVKAREERDAPPPPAEPARKDARARPTKPRRSARTTLGLLEAEIEKKEAEVAGSTKLAVDWSDVDTIAAHARAGELTSLFER